MKIPNVRHILIKMSILMLISIASSCSKDAFEPEPVEDLNLAVTTTNSKVIKDQYIVLLSKKPAKNDPRAEAALEALSGEVRKLPQAKIKATFSKVLTGFTAKLDEKQLEKLRRDSRVLEIIPDRYIELDETDIVNTVNIQEYPTWGLDRLDQREGPMDRAYSFTATGRGVNAYIMDSGIRYSHDEFGERASLAVDLVKQFPEEEYDVDDPDLELGNDCNGHGTHVAGTVGGKTYGVAKEINLFSVRVFSCRGITSESRVIQAIEWITENAVHPAVVNMSLGGASYEPIDVAMENSISTGIHYVTSAGNSNDDACNYSPARTPGAITVGATDINNDKANFSNYGDCLDVYAPGYNVNSASIENDFASVAKSGTSMAAPHVTGLAALYLEKNQDISPAGLHDEIILNSTKDLVGWVPSGPNRFVHSLWEPVVVTPPAPPTIDLKVIGIANKRESQIYLVWEPTDDPSVNIYHNGTLIDRALNTGEYSLYIKGNGSDDVFMVCEFNYDNCSEGITPNFDVTDFEPNKPPTASFDHEINDIEVTFTDTSTDSDGTISRRYLYFGDGYYTTAQSVVYTYREPGNYLVELYVTDNHENTSYTVKEITVGTVIPSPESLELSAVGSKVQGQWQTELSWNVAGASAQIDIYRNGTFFRTVDNTGQFTDRTTFKGGGSLEYRVCGAGTATCSNPVTVHF